MCFSAAAAWVATNATAITAAATVAATAGSIYANRQAGKRAESAARAQRDAAARLESQQRETEAGALISENARVAARRQALRNNSLMTGAGNESGPSGVLSGGKPTLGG